MDTETQVYSIKDGSKYVTAMFTPLNIGYISGLVQTMVMQWTNSIVMCG